MNMQNLIWLATCIDETVDQANMVKIERFWGNKELPNELEA